LEERRRPRRLRPREDHPGRDRAGHNADRLRLQDDRGRGGAPPRGHGASGAAEAPPRARCGYAAHLDGDQIRPDAVREARHPRGSRRSCGPRHVRPRHGGDDGARHAQQILRRLAAHHPHGALLAAWHEPAGRSVAHVRGGRERDHAPALHAGRLLLRLDLHLRRLPLAAAPHPQHERAHRHGGARRLPLQRPDHLPRWRDLLRGGGHARYLRPLRPLDGDALQARHQRRPAGALRPRAAAGDRGPGRRGDDHPEQRGRARRHGRLATGRQGAGGRRGHGGRDEHRRGAGDGRERAGCR
jgi:hypothetical protein